MSTTSSGNSDADVTTATATTAADDAVATPNEIATAEDKTNENANELPEKIASAESDASATETSDTKHDSEYEKFITYDANGTAIYTNPSTGAQCTFDVATNQWVPCASDASSTDNPYENEYYRWCHDTNKWVLKESAKATADASSSATENEFYRWDAERHQWIPKMKNDSNAASEYKDGVHTYTDKDGVVFFWDTEKNAWFPRIDDDFMAVYQMNYGFNDNGEPAPTTATVSKNDVEKADEESSKEKDTANTEETDAEEAKKVDKKRKADASKLDAFI